VLPFPLLIYYVTTLGIPLLNGSFREHAFWEHFVFVIVLPLLVVTPVLYWQLRKSVDSRRTRNYDAAPKQTQSLSLDLMRSNRH
jgi:hypothetical protein